MIAKDYVFPYPIHGGFLRNAFWEGDTLSVTVERHRADDSAPKLLEINFRGVTWMRSTCHTSCPTAEKNGGFCNYTSSKPIESYLLIERERFATDAAEFLIGSGSDLNTIRALDDGILFLDDRFIFSCTDVEIVHIEHIPAHIFDILDELTDNGEVTYHDGGIFDIKYEGDALEFCCFRFESDWKKEEDSNFKNCIRLRFCGVSELEIYNYDEEEYLPYREGDFEEGGRWSPYIGDLDFWDGKIVFEDSLRFQYKEAAVLEKFREEF